MRNIFKNMTVIDTFITTDGKRRASTIEVIGFLDGMNTLVPIVDAAIDAWDIDTLKSIQEKLQKTLNTEFGYLYELKEDVVDAIENGEARVIYEAGMKRATTEVLVPRSSYELNEEGFTMEVGEDWYNAGASIYIKSLLCDLLKSDVRANKFPYRLYEIIVKAIELSNARY